MKISSGTKQGPEVKHENEVVLHHSKYATCAHTQININDTQIQTHIEVKHENEAVLGHSKYATCAHTQININDTQIQTHIEN